MRLTTAALALGLAASMTLAEEATTYDEFPDHGNFDSSIAFYDMPNFQSKEGSVPNMYYKWDTCMLIPDCIGFGKECRSWRADVNAVCTMFVGGGCQMESTVPAYQDPNMVHTTSEGHVYLSYKCKQA